MGEGAVRSQRFRDSIGAALGRRAFGLTIAVGIFVVVGGLARIGLS